MKSYKKHFGHFLAQNEGTLHFAAHSHHLWPDVAREGHLQCWEDASRLVDAKWEKIFGEVIPEAQQHIAKQLHLPDPETLCFAPNTHEFVLRVVSALPRGCTVLCSDAEFHSARRQFLRWQESDSLSLEVVPAEPFSDFSSRFLERARSLRPELIYLSSVFFNSGYAVDCLRALADEVGDSCTVVIDGYHAFMATPLDLREVQDRIFFIAGGYKYAMSGEGVCFMHCPPGRLPRPVNTGWFAGFEGLEDEVAVVSYPDSGQRFAGSTFDPSGLYRFNAVQRWLQTESVSIDEIHSRVLALQKQFCDRIRKDWGIGRPMLEGNDPRGNFLTFRTERASDAHQALSKEKVTCDVRGDRLRLGFGLYHEPDDVEELLRRCDRAFRS